MHYVLSFALILFAWLQVSAQNTGIGTANPQSKLHVNGRVLADSISIGSNSTDARVNIHGTLRIADGTEGSGKVLRSDSNGKAAWENMQFGDMLTNIPAPDASCAALSGSVGTPVPTSITVSGNYAYVVNEGNSTMKVINISNPASPVIAGSLATANTPRSIAVSGNYVYVISAAGLLQVINIGNPAAPIVAGSVATSSNPHSVAVSGNYVYIAGTNAGNTLQVINISNPASPVVVGSLLLPVVSRDNCIAVQGNYAYVIASSSDVLKIVDISNPALPFVAGTLTTADEPTAIAVSGKYAYLTNFNISNLQVIDVSNAAAPAVAGIVGTGSFAGDVAVSGNYAFVANLHSVQVFNVSNPAMPRLIKTVDANFVERSVAVSGNYAFVGTSWPSEFQSISLFCDQSIHFNPQSGQVGAMPKVICVVSASGWANAATGTNYGAGGYFAPNTISASGTSEDTRLINQGNCYNAGTSNATTTGLFTASVSGAYTFSFRIMDIPAGRLLLAASLNGSAPVEILDEFIGGNCNLCDDRAYSTTIYLKAGDTHRLLRHQSSVAFSSAIVSYRLQQ